jgi:hypothetical protein
VPSAQPAESGVTRDTGKAANPPGDKEGTVTTTWFVGMMAMAIGLASCSAHSPFHVKNTTDVTVVSAQTYPAHQRQVFVTTASLPGAAKYEVLAELEVGRVWYGSRGKVVQSLANAARGLGGDAVIEIRTWHQPAGWSWAAPHGSGKIVKITDPASVDLGKVEGSWQ